MPKSSFKRGTKTGKRKNPWKDQEHSRLCSKMCSSHWEEAPGKTQDTLEGLCLSAGLGTPRGPPGRAGGSGRGEGSLGLPA